MSNNEIKYLEAVDVATDVLRALADSGIESNMAQAALGNAWYRLCRSMKFPPSIFWELVNEMGKEFEKDAIEDEKCANSMKDKFKL